MRRFAGWMKNAPITTKATSGMSFAIVTTSMIRAPLRTPRTLISTSKAITPMIATGEIHAGAPAISRITEPTKIVATAAPAASPVTSSNTPAMNPTKGPSATSTYA